MMPLSMMTTGKETVIKKLGEKKKQKDFLENLGFVTGGAVTVISEMGGI